MFPNEAQHLFDWTYTSKLSWGDYLVAKKFERSIRFAIDDQTRQIVGTSRELADRGFDILTDGGSRTDAGFTVISHELTDLRQGFVSGIDQLDRALQWGFGAIIDSLGVMNTTLSELVRLARTPAATWAYEQFDHARDEYRRGLFEEALRSVSRAISGYQTHPGYETEFRFQFFLGTLRLGDHRNSSPEVVDLAAAEAAFLKAARYAETDHPADAGRALICAGRAADVQKALERAIIHTRAGLVRVPNSPDGHYQLARALCALGDRNEASKALYEAILLDDSQALRATNELVFLSSGQFLTSVLEAARTHYEQRLHRTLSSFETALGKIRQFDFDGFQAKELLQPELEGIDSSCRTAADNATKTNTIFSYAANDRILRHTEGNFSGLFEVYKGRIYKKFESTKANLKEAKALPRPDPGPGIGVGVLMFPTACTSQAYYFDHWDRSPGIGNVLVLSLGAAFLAGLIFYVFDFLRYERLEGQRINVIHKRAQIDEKIGAVVGMTSPGDWAPHLP